MFEAFQVALSGMKANGVGLDVVGNNLANMNTAGFKASTVSFSDLFSETLGVGGVNQVGLGVGSAHTQRQFNQGTTQTTNGAYDSAIQGNGFYLVKNSSNQTLYTRAGNFQLDAAGNVLTATGEKVQGWMAVGGQINTSGAVGNIALNLGQTVPPSATTKMSATINLNASGTVGNADGSFSTPIQVVDSLGTTHVVTLNFTKTAANSWSYSATVPGADVKAGTAGTPYAVPGVTGTLTFDSSGKLTSPTAANPVSVKIPGLNDGASDMNVSWNLYDSTGAPMVTQIAQASAASNTTQDGVQPGEISKVQISDGGVITAQYSNGTKVNIAQLALATVTNPNSLQGVGNNEFLASASTSAPTVGAANTGGRGEILGGSLESSTVDMGTEFTNLIVYQRSYQSNAKVITTADTLSQDTLSLIR
jgi:flagellar hook protein FlgE